MTGVRKHWIAWLALVVGSINPTAAHDLPQTHVTIDTDMALDDARALEERRCSRGGIEQ